MDMTISPEVLFCMSLFNGGLCAALAQRKGRRLVAWFAIGFAIGLIGLAILAFLPKPKVKEVLPRPVLDQRIEYNWYYITQDKETIGPLSDQRFEELKESGVITESTYVWNESMSEWTKLGELVQPLVPSAV